MILHKFNSSPFKHATITNSLPIIKTTDGIVLTEDAVYTLLDDTLCAKLSSFSEQIYVLQPDLNARGLTQKHDSFNSIDYSDLVNLTLTFDKVISW